MESRDFASSNQELTKKDGNLYIKVRDRPLSYTLDGVNRSASILFDRQFELFRKEKLSIFGDGSGRQYRLTKKEEADLELLRELNSRRIDKFNADITLDSEAVEPEVKPRNEAILKAENEAGITNLGDFVWVDGAKGISGVITLPRDTYSRVYVARGSYEKPEIMFIDDKPLKDKPYYEKKDGKTYIYMDTFSGGGGEQQSLSSLNISDNVLHLDASSITGMDDNEAVALWADLSGNDYHCSQSTGAKQPLYKTNIINGKPVVRFDGADDLLVSSDTAFSTSGYFTAFVVMQSSDVGGSNSIQNPVEWASHFFLNWDHTAGGDARFRVSFEATDDSYPTTNFAYTPISDPMIVVGRNDGTDVLAMRNGAVNSVKGHGQDIKDSLWYSFGIGGAPWDGFYFDGDIAEVIIYERVLTNSEVEAVTAYLDDKYDLDSPEFLLPETRPTAWFNANDLVDLANNDQVESWKNRNGWESAVQATESKRPLYRADQIEGNPVVDFDGSDDLMVLTDGYLAYTGEFTLFVLVKADADPKTTGVTHVVEHGNSVGMVWDASASADVSRFAYQDSNDNWHDAPYGPVVGNSVYLISANYDGTNIKAWRNGELITDDISPALKNHGWNVLGIGGAPWDGFYFDGKIGEIILFDSTLSTAEMETVEDYFKLEWLGFHGVDFNWQTRRLLGFGESLVGQTLRAVVSGEILEGQTSRILSGLESLLVQSRRFVRLKDSALYQTRRILASIGTYIAQTKRIVVLKESITAQSRRVVRTVTSLLGQTKRAITVFGSSLYQTKRMVSGVGSKGYQTLRTLSSATLRKYQTLRSLDKASISSYQTLRNVLSKLDRYYQTARVVIAKGLQAVQTKRTVLSKGIGLFQTRRILSVVDELISAQTQRLITAKKVAGWQTERVVILKDLVKGQTARVVRSGATAVYQSFRTVTDLARDTGQLLRTVWSGVTGHYQLRRLLGELVVYSYQARRIIVTLQTVTAQTFRVVFSGVADRYQTSRRVIDYILATAVAQTRRILVDLATLSGQTSRTVFKLSSTFFQTRRMLSGIVTSVYQTARKVYLGIAFSMLCLREVEPDYSMKVAGPDYTVSEVGADYNIKEVIWCELY